MMEAILALLPLDSFVRAPLAVMEKVRRVASPPAAVVTRERCAHAPAGRRRAHRCRVSEGVATEPSARSFAWPIHPETLTHRRRSQTRCVADCSSQPAACGRRPPLQAHGQPVAIERIERFAFYERAKKARIGRALGTRRAARLRVVLTQCHSPCAPQAFCVLATGETRLYGALHRVPAGE
jgi:L-fucose mutarotase/ribose pyranase (RbsD/FucU family)